MVSTSRITDFFDHSAHASKKAKRDDSLPHSPEALSSEGPVIMDISEAENTAHARRLRSLSPTKTDLHNHLSHLWTHFYGFR